MSSNSLRRFQNCVCHFCSLKIDKLMHENAKFIWFGGVSMPHGAWMWYTQKRARHRVLAPASQTVGSLLGITRKIDHEKGMIMAPISCKTSSIFKQHKWNITFRILKVSFISCHIALVLAHTSIEQHILGTNAGKKLVLSCHICLINTGVEKMNI